VQSVSKQAFK